MKESMNEIVFKMLRKFGSLMQKIGCDMQKKKVRILFQA